MNKTFLLLILAVSMALSYKMEGIQGYKKARFPEKWSAETALYIGPAAGKCPYADSFSMGSVAFDKENKAARFDTLFNNKGGNAHTTWAFVDDDENLSLYHFDREEGKCTFSNATTYSETFSTSLGKKAKYLNSYSIGSQMVDFFKFTKGDYNAMFSLTSQAHLPVRASGSKSHSLLYSIDYINAKLDYASFTFELPYECQQAKLTGQTMKENSLVNTLLKSFELI